MRYYVAGPMTNVEDWNFPAFHEAARRLRLLGHEVINPADNDNGDTSHDRAHYMRQDIGHVLAVEGVAVLPGWQNSRGAKLEVLLAIELGLPIIDAETLEPIKPTVVAAVLDIHWASVA